MPLSAELEAFTADVTCTSDGYYGGGCGQVYTVTGRKLFRSLNPEDLDDFTPYFTAECPNCGAWTGMPRETIENISDETRREVWVRDFRDNGHMMAWRKVQRDRRKAQAAEMAEELAQHYEAAGFSDYRTRELAGRTDTEVRRMHARMLKEAGQS